MMANLFGSGSNGNPKVEEALQQRLLMQAFGMKDDTEPLFSDAVVAGDDSESGYPGILTVRLYPATPMTPQVRLQLLTTGELLTTPKLLAKVADELARYAVDVVPVYEKAREDAKSMEVFKMFSGMSQ